MRTAAMTGRKSQKEINRSMSKVLCSLRRRASRLQDENEQLQYKHQLLAEMCDGFELFRQLRYQALQTEAGLQGAVCDPESQLELSSHMEHSNLCTDDELQLLMQLQSLPPAKLGPQDLLKPAKSTSTGASSSGMTLASTEAPASDGGDTTMPTATGPAAGPAPAAAEAATAGPQPVAPLNDSLWILKQTLWQPPALDVSGVTLPQLIGMYRGTVRELSLCLVRIDAGMTYSDLEAGSKTHEQKIQELMMEHWRMISVLCTSRPELVTMLQLVNTDTGEVFSEPDQQRAAWVLQHLHLSSQQQQRIAQSAVLFKQLLSPVLEELRQLQQQQKGEKDAANGVNYGGIGECSGNGACSSSAAATPAAVAACAAAGPSLESVSAESASMPQPFTHGRILEQQQQRSARMTTLLRKDHFMRTWFASHLFGCLSWIQIARMHVLLSPMYPIPYVFYTEVAKQVAQQRGRKFD